MNNEKEPNEVLLLERELERTKELRLALAKQKALMMLMPKTMKRT